ncbi:MAG: NAD-dependent epimerase/dehydratase family protein, partial [SAR202 cluster bacterium]|nr:NAD-dependent epimerase/dehydratase family protein [SAR202 cluster bacterium]
MTGARHRVAITGAAGYIGTSLIRRLEREEAVTRILAIDIRPLPQPPSPKVTYVRRTVMEPLDDLIRKHEIDTVVHLAFVLQPGHNEHEIRKVNLEGTRKVMQSAVAAGAGHLLYFSSTTVYGAHPDNPPLLTEESPVRPVKGFQYGEDKAESERIIHDLSSSHPAMKVVVLRGCPVLGPGADNFISRAFTKPMLVSLRGFDPSMQLLHEEDLVDIMTQCIRKRVSGLYNVAGEADICWSEMGRILNRKLLAVPPALLYGLTDLAWKLRLQSDSPSPGLAFIHHPWIVSTEKVRTRLG